MGRVTQEGTTFRSPSVGPHFRQHGACALHALVHANRRVPRTGGHFVLRPLGYRGDGGEYARHPVHDTVVGPHRAQAIRFFFQTRARFVQTENGLKIVAADHIPIEPRRRPHFIRKRGGSQTADRRPPPDHPELGDCDDSEREDDSCNHFIHRM